MASLLTPCPLLHACAGQAALLDLRFDLISVDLYHIKNSRHREISQLISTRAQPGTSTELAERRLPPPTTGQLPREFGNIFSAWKGEPTKAMPGLPNFNTTATRDAASDVLVKAFPGGDKQVFRDLMDTHPTIITVEKGYDVYSREDGGDQMVLGKITSVCIVKIWDGAELEEGVQSWLEIKWLGTDPDFKGQGYGMATLRGALRYAQSHGVQDQFALRADVTTIDFYRTFMMAISDALGYKSGVESPLTFIRSRSGLVTSPTSNS
jgi:GNAT superfamily N-acetyltransferase